MRLVSPNIGSLVTADLVVGERCVDIDTLVARERCKVFLGGRYFDLQFREESSVRFLDLSGLRKSRK